MDAASEAWGRHAHGWPEALQAYSQVVARVKVPGGKRYASPLWRRHPPRFHELHAWAHSHCTGAVTAQRALHVGPAPQVAGEARAAASAQALAVPRAAGRLAAAAPRELAAALAGFLARVCAAGALRVADRAARTPEALGLRALPQFATLAAAQKVCVTEELARPTSP